MVSRAIERPTRDGAMHRGGVPRVVRDRPAIVLVLALGLAVRALLVPLASGVDFHIWDLSAAATLRGEDVYVHTPLPLREVGPYAYFPLYLYLLIPLKWLSLHTSLPFVVLGKLPVLVGDVMVALSVAAALRRSGSGERAAALGAAAFFWNPLVLYNGAWYGRFDTLCLGTLLLAWRQLDRPMGLSMWRLAGWYGLSVTLKTFPIFLLPYILRRTGARRGLPVVALSLLLPLAVSMPYLVDNARRFAYVVFLYDSIKGPRQFSWQVALLHAGLSERTATVVSFGLLGLFLLAMLAPSRYRSDAYVYAAVIFTLFLLLSKVVYEQYLLWPLPFLVVLSVRDGSRAAALTAAVLSLVGILANPWLHPWGYRPYPALELDVTVAVACLIFVLSRLAGREMGIVRKGPARARWEL